MNPRDDFIDLDAKPSDSDGATPSPRSFNKKPPPLTSFRQSSGSALRFDAILGADTNASITSRPNDSDSDDSSTGANDNERTPESASSASSDKSNSPLTLRQSPSLSGDTRSDVEVFKALSSYGVSPLSLSITIATDRISLSPSQSIVEISSDLRVDDSKSPITPQTSKLPNNYFTRIVMPTDEVISSASVLKISQELTLEGENRLVDSILKSNTLNASVTDDPRKHIEEMVFHIWEENIEILSLARHFRPVGIYYTHGINKTVMATGRQLLNREEFFIPQNVSFLTKYGKDANFEVTTLAELDPKLAGGLEDFNFTDALIFLPICYTARHAVKEKELLEVLKYFVFEKKCSVMVYLGRDAGLEENKIKRNNWLNDNLKYIEEVQGMNKKFWEDNPKIAITIMHREKLVTEPEYRYAEYYFAHFLKGVRSIFNAMVQDVVGRLKEKMALSIPSKPIAIKKSYKPLSPQPRSETPQLLPHNNISLLSQRPQSFPSAQPASAPDVAQALSEKIKSGHEYQPQTTARLYQQEANPMKDIFTEIAKESMLRSPRLAAQATTLEMVAAVSNLSLSDEKDDQEERVHSRSSPR